MSDFDFDELDKAVSGALGSASTPDTTAAPTPREDTPSVPVAERSAPIPAARRATGGRFMDVVHPSSDMRTPAPSAARTSAPASSPIPKPPVIFPSSEVTAAESTETQKSDEQSADWTKPLESPFLPDAKVEKRPLGGFGGGLDAVDPEQIPDFPLPETGEVELLEAPDEPRLEATATDTPAEESSEVVEVEKEDAQPVEETPETSETPETASAPETPSSVPAPDPAEVGPIAITQQYQEKPSTEQESGAIFDTEAYHQPVAAPAKKRSGAWTILWVVLLVLVGAGLGVFGYYFILPSL